MSSIKRNNTSSPHIGCISPSMVPSLVDGDIIRICACAASRAAAKSIVTWLSFADDADIKEENSDKKFCAVV